MGELSIQEIQILAAFKTNNPNISEQEAVQVLDNVVPTLGLNMVSQNVNAWGVQSNWKSYCGGNNVAVAPSPNTPDKIALKLQSLSEKYYGAINEKDFQTELNKINQSNAIAIWKQYNKISPDESLIEMICDEKANSTADRKNAVQKVFNALIAEAKSKGVDTSHFENEFKADLNYQFRKIGSTSTEKLDKIANTLVFATHNKASLTPEQKIEIKNTPANIQYSNTNQAIENRLSTSKTSFTGQLKQDGWAADVADFVSKSWGSDNTADKTRGDLTKAGNQLKQLQSAQTNGKYDLEFYKIFGLEHDAENIQAYENKETIYKSAAMNKGFEDAYNNTLKTLLESPRLHEETMYIPSMGSGMGQHVVVADKWDVYNREVANLKKFLGENASDTLMIEFRKAHLENASMDEKFAFLHNKAKEISKQLHTNTVTAGEGKEFAEVEKEYQYSYNAAFGVKNDIMKRVNDYNVSQQVGGGVVKMATVGGVAIGASFFTGGSSLALLTVAGVTAGASATVEVSDRFSSGQVIDAFKKEGFGAGMKKGAEVTDWGETLKNATIAGGTVLIGGGIAKGIQFVSKGLTTTQQAALMFGSDIAFSAASEKLMTGEITLEGMTFSVLLSATGNVIAIKQAGKLSNTGKTQLNTNVTHETPIIKPITETAKITTNEPVVNTGKTPAVKDIGLPKPTVEAIANAAVKPTNAHMNTKGTEFFSALTAEEKAIVKLHGIDEDNVTAIHGILRKKLTELDNANVIEARYRGAKAGSLNPKSLTQIERDVILSPFIDNMLKTPQGKKLVIITGRGGSGKSTIVRKTGLDKTHLLLDSDEIKPLIPGFKEHGANYVHKASTDLNEELLIKALARGHNIVFPTTGWHDYVEALIVKAHNAGYDVQLIHSNIKTKTSITRAIERYEKGELLPDGSTMHRFVDPTYIESGTYVDGVIAKFKSNPFINEDILLYDNNGAYPPKLIEKIKK